MDVTRAISYILPPPARREDGGAQQFGRRSAGTAPEDLRVEKAPSLEAERHHSRDDIIKSNRETSPVPVKLREIQATFTSARETTQSSHTAYSAQFLAQQLAQQNDAMTDADPAEAHRRATSAYGNSLNLTVTVLGFDGHAERIA